MNRLMWVALIALAVAAGWSWWGWRATSADLVELRERMRGHEAAARLRAAELVRQAEAAALDRELQEGKGADAPLSDYLRAGAGRLWP